MAESSTSGEPDRIARTASSTSEEKEIKVPCASKSDMGPAGIPKEDQRCYRYRHISVLNSLCSATKAVWHIEVERFDKNGKVVKREGGTCFLGKFDVENPCGRPHQVHGLFTAFHVLGEEEIRKRNECTFTVTNQGLPLREQRRDLPLRITENTFCFTCPLLDATFIEFDQQLVDKVYDEHKSDFLHVYTGWHGPEGETEFTILHYPRGRDQFFSHGHLEEWHGLHLFHSVSTEKGSSGAPVLVADGEMCHVVAIHIARSESDSENYNVAVANESVFAALKLAWKKARAGTGDPVSHHPEKDELERLEKNYLNSMGLQLQEARSKVPGTPRIPFYFTRRLRVIELEEVIPIHFVLTSHGWYWSAIAPDAGAEEPNWVSAKSNVFGRGRPYKYEGKPVDDEPAEGKKRFSFAELRSISLERNVENIQQQLGNALLGLKIDKQGHSKSNP